MNKMLISGILLLNLNLGAQDLYILEDDNQVGQDSIEILIRGKGGYCSSVMHSDGTIGKTDCIRLENSKKVKILCTKNKEMCKTENEVFNYIQKKLSSKEEVIKEEKIEAPVQSIPKQKEILEVVDVKVDWENLIGKRACVKGDIKAYDGSVSLNDDMNSLTLKMDNLSRNTKKKILKNCGYGTSNCTDLIVCGNFKKHSFLSEVYLVIDDIKE